MEIARSPPIRIGVFGNENAMTDKMGVRNNMNATRAYGGKVAASSCSMSVIG